MIERFLGKRKRVALVAHDNEKRDLLEWAGYNATTLEQHELIATGTTGSLLEKALGLTIRKLQSGPLGAERLPPNHEPYVMREIGWG